MKPEDIPREDLLEMLRDAVWYSGGQTSVYDRQGYSLDVSADTAVTGVNYRNAPLFKTPDDAIVGHWERCYSPEGRAEAQSRLAQIKERLANGLLPDGTPIRT